MTFMSDIEEKITNLKEKYSLKCNIPKFEIGSKSCDMAIVQGGMGVGISLSKLANAVAREGGIGVIAANAIGMIEPDYFENHIEANVRALRNEIKKTRERTNGLIGVNIMIAVDCFAQLLDVAIDEKVDVLFLGAGLPIKNIPVKRIRENRISLVPIVSSARAAKIIFRSWEKMYDDVPDGVVVEGPKAGGHLGFKYDQIDDPQMALENIVPQVVAVMNEYEQKRAKKLPVIAAGGVFTGEDIYTFIKLGASAVQMGTRFVATHECDADIRFKQSYINAQEGDVTIISSPVGLPGRAINNQFLKDVAEGKKKEFKCPSRCLASCKAKEAQYCISEALNNARLGEMADGFAFAGTNVGRVEKIVSVKELASSLKTEYTMAAIKDSLMSEYDAMADKLAVVKNEYSETLANVAARVQESIKTTSLESEMKFKQQMESLSEMMESAKIEYNSMLDKLAQLKEEMTFLNGNLALEG